MVKVLYNADLRTIQSALQVRADNLRLDGRLEASKCVQETLQRIISFNVGDTVLIESMKD